MIRGDNLYIWQSPDWARWRYNLAALAEPLAQVNKQREAWLKQIQAGNRVQI